MKKPYDSISPAPATPQEIAEGVCDAFNAHHKPGDAVWLKGNRSGRRKRTIGTRGAFVDGGCVIVDLVPIAGWPDFVHARNVRWSL